MQKPLTIQLLRNNYMLYTMIVELCVMYPKQSNAFYHTIRGLRPYGDGKFLVSKTYTAKYAIRKLVTKTISSKYQTR